MELTLTRLCFVFVFVFFLFDLILAGAGIDLCAVSLYRTGEEGDLQQ